ncbi:Acid phosphatase [Apiospora hydei]|uniref:Acid phosphatase n=1 Tax=Apiospora hydei TaxID=1337664 RepID=A0ABR1VWS2_9PEZI
MFLKPTLSFTIPSIHDGHKLDCRVFHAPSLLTPPSAHAQSEESPEDKEQHTNAPPWGRHIAIVAHPYAPLGGSYDDPIVDVIGSILAQAGFVVATFNFRGASKSGGKTSWTSKPEQGDYMSVVGFLAYYAHYLDISSRAAAEGHTSLSPVLLQCGYSYGAIVTTKIPPLDSILASFHSPAVHTSAADIRLRAQHLAEQQNRLASMPISPRKSLGMRVGGDEDTSPRKSHEVRRSRSFEREEKIRKGVKDILGRSKLVRRRRRGDQPKPDNADAAHDEHHEVDCMPVATDFPKFRAAYLAVSPPIGLMTNLATMSLPNPFGSWSRKRSRLAPGSSEGQETATEPQNESEAAEQKLVRNPTLAVYGDQDGMAQVHKFREWAAKLKGHPGSQFLDVEISGAGHFWWEEGVIYQLRSAIETYAASLIKDEAVRFQTSALPETSISQEKSTQLDKVDPPGSPAVPETSTQTSIQLEKFALPN